MTRDEWAGELLMKPLAGKLSGPRLSDWTSTSWFTVR
jgi:hypothetical protein